MQLVGPDPPFAHCVFGVPVAAIAAPAGGHGFCPCNQALVSALLLLWHCKLLQKKPADPSLAEKVCTTGWLAGSCRPAAPYDCCEKAAGKTKIPFCIAPEGLGTLAFRKGPGVKVLTPPM